LHKAFIELKLFKKVEKQKSQKVCTGLFAPTDLLRNEVQYNNNNDNNNNNNKAFKPISIYIVTKEHTFSFVELQICHYKVSRSLGNFTGT
jgi:hypothetical protein